MFFLCLMSGQDKTSMLFWFLSIGHNFEFLFGIVSMLKHIYYDHHFFNMWKKTNRLPTVLEVILANLFPPS